MNKKRKHLQQVDEPLHRIDDWQHGWCSTANPDPNNMPAGKLSLPFCNATTESRWHSETMDTSVSNRCPGGSDASEALHPAGLRAEQFSGAIYQDYLEMATQE